MVSLSPDPRRPHDPHRRSAPWGRAALVCLVAAFAMVIGTACLSYLVGGNGAEKLMFSSMLLYAFIPPMISITSLVKREPRTRAWITLVLWAALPIFIIVQMVVTT